MPSASPIGAAVLVLTMNRQRGRRLCEPGVQRGQRRINGYGNDHFQPPAAGQRICNIDESRICPQPLGRWNSPEKKFPRG
jgi:hypothetical protein